MRSAGRSRVRMEAGWRDGSAFNKQTALSPCCWLYLEIMLLILLILPWQLLTLPHRCSGQSYALKIVNRCFGGTPRCNSPDPYAFEVGCDVHIMCAYNGCTNDSDRNLAVFYGQNINQTIVQSPGCNVTMKLQNVTLEDKGLYTCADLNDDPYGQCRNRFLKFGYCPEEPRNMTIMYIPKESIKVWVDPVKIGYELHDNKTSWTVSYEWDPNSKRKSCPDQEFTKCEHLDREGCEVCNHILRKYKHFGNYSDGSISTSITYIVSARNIVGSISTNKSFIPIEWVKPGAVKSINIVHTSSSKLFFRIKAPRNIDQTHLFHMSHSELTGLTFNYTVDPVPLQVQYLHQNGSEGFYKRYGFFRNTEDDATAMRAVLLASDLPRISPVIPWQFTERNSSHPSSKKIKITHLPLAGYLYNISVQTKARYWGDVLSALAKANESAPAEGPQFEDNFAFCPVTEEPCAVCFIYFKEIPLPKRGGIILNHTVTLTLLNGDAGQSDSTCRKNSSIKVTTGGQNNTFHLIDLPFGANYSVSLQAWNKKGPSPASSTFLFVHSKPPDFAAQNIVLEKEDVYVSEGQFYDIDITWTQGHTDTSTTVNNSISMCHTIPLPLYGNRTQNGSSLPDVFFNCVDNFRIKVTEPGFSLERFNRVHKRNGLTPTFFVSTTISDHQKSQLLAPQCFYTKGKVPDRVPSLTLKPWKGHSQTIEVNFRLPCGKDLHYKYGLPHRYVIKSAIDDQSRCIQQCSKIMKNAEQRVRAMIKGSLQDTVVEQVGKMETGVPHCVGVSVYHANQGIHEWTCQTITLPDVSDSADLKDEFVVILLLSVILIGASICLACFCCCRKKKLEKKYFKKTKFSDIQVVPSQKGKKNWLASQDNNQFAVTNRIRSQDEAVLVEDEDSTSISSLEDTQSTTLPTDRSGRGINHMPSQDSAGLVDDKDSISISSLEDTQSTTLPTDRSGRGINRMPSQDTAGLVDDEDSTSISSLEDTQSTTLPIDRSGRVISHMPSQDSAGLVDDEDSTSISSLEDTQSTTLPIDRSGRVINHMPSQDSAGLVDDEDSTSISSLEDTQSTTLPTDRSGRGINRMLSQDSAGLVEDEDSTSISSLEDTQSISSSTAWQGDMSGVPYNAGNYGDWSAFQSLHSMSSSPEMTSGLHTPQGFHELCAADEISPHASHAELFPLATGISEPFRESRQIELKEGEVISAWIPRAEPAADGNKKEMEDKAVEKKASAAGEITSLRNSATSTDKPPAERGQSEGQDGSLSLDLLIQAAKDSPIFEVKAEPEVVNDAQSPQIIINNHSDPESGFDTDPTGTSSSAECLTANDCSSLIPASLYPDVTTHDKNFHAPSASQSKWKLKRSKSHDHLQSDRLTSKVRTNSSSENIPLLEMKSVQENRHGSSAGLIFPAENTASLPTGGQSKEMFRMDSFHVPDNHYCKVTGKDSNESLV